MPEVKETVAYEIPDNALPLYDSGGAVTGYYLPADSVAFPDSLTVSLADGATVSLSKETIKAIQPVTASDYSEQLAFLGSTSLLLCFVLFALLGASLGKVITEMMRA